MAGHSKWAGIKHKKAIVDARRGKLFTKLARAITVAAKEGGGDPASNSALALAVSKAKDASIVLLDLATNQPTVDYLRDQGFMAGFGIDVKDPNKYGDEDDKRICTHEISQGDQEKGRTAMENALTKCPNVNLVYTINEPAAAGAWEALKAVGKDDGSVMIVSVDGGCPGVKNVQAGVIGATSQQYPLKMASMALDAIVSGKIPTIDPKMGFLDTGAQLVTAKAADGVPSISVDEGLKLCWG